jgi:2-polyprenyl-6-methoxyphenol hydroxylase-like FAD-dependent oxidoreductase
LGDFVHSRRMLGKPDIGMEVAIIGGGICGLSLALNLQERAIDCRIYGRAPEIKPLGVGITRLSRHVDQHRQIAELQGGISACERS